MNIKEAIEFLEKTVENPRIELPQEVFLFISRLTPMVNVDLLIKDENRQTLLSWRKDQFVEAGWHVPGGIIRFKEKSRARIQKVAELEVGTAVEVIKGPIAFNEILLDFDSRGHFISLLYECFLSNNFTLRNDGKAEKDTGFLKWHDTCPDDLIKYHDIYRKYI
jgi:colanic acid biosynthesis protein WcaH